MNLYFQEKVCKLKCFAWTRKITRLNCLNVSRPLEKHSLGYKVLSYATMNANVSGKLVQTARLARHVSSSMFLENAESVAR